VRIRCGKYIQVVHYFGRFPYPSTCLVYLFTGGDLDETCTTSGLNFSGTCENEHVDKYNQIVHYFGGFS
jgi:hypothetical protein